MWSKTDKFEGYNNLPDFFGPEFSQKIRRIHQYWWFTWGTLYKIHRDLGISENFRKIRSKKSGRLLYPSNLSVLDHIWWEVSTSRLEKTDRSDFLFFAPFSRNVALYFPIFPQSALYFPLRAGHGLGGWWRRPRDRICDDFPVFFPTLDRCNFATACPFGLPRCARECWGSNSFVSGVYGCCRRD